MVMAVSDNEKQSLSIFFEPFREETLIDLFETEGSADVSTILTLYFGGDDIEYPLKLAETLLSSVRSGANHVEVVGRLAIYHRDESLPPTPFDEDAPEWLQQIIDTYRKDGGPALLKELERLQGIVDAVTSPQPDSHFNKEQNAARAAVLESRSSIQEKLDVAVDALKYYAEGSDGARARQAILFADIEDS